jgi:hypothetical protein
VFSARPNGFDRWRENGLGSPISARPKSERVSAYQGESRLLDSPEDVCPGQARFEYPATSVPFSNFAEGEPITSAPTVGRDPEPVNAFETQGRLVY